MKKETKNRFMLSGIMAIILFAIFSLIFLVGSLTSEDRAALEGELNSLISDLNSNSYSWTVGSNLNKFINNDNLMLSIDNKILTL
jgi:hypothetical protein